MDKTTLGNRMKDYEDCYDFRIPKKFPIIIRLDGRAFHTWTKKTHCVKPFDSTLMSLMADTTKYLCESISGCIFGYTQSDEISLLLRDDQSIMREPWFNKRIQKIVSISASIATYYFNVNNSHDTKVPAFFDSRVFSIPEDAIQGYFIWRQNDATKNSLSLLAQSLYSHNQLSGKRHDELMEMCFQKGHNWNDLPTPQKRGYSVYKVPVQFSNDSGSVERMKFIIDSDIPIFTSDEGKIWITKQLIRSLNS